jgi:predicted RNA-binding protein associated with RNAse of E/G family
MEEEIWKPIKGYEGRYKISNKRKVVSLKRYSANGRLLREKELKFSKINKKYDVVQLIDSTGKPKLYYVDRLMFEHFNI